jgi:hypothetical protein
MFMDMASIVLPRHHFNATLIIAARRLLSGLLQPLALAEPDPRASAVLVDEFDAPSLKSSFNYGNGRTARLSCAPLQLPHGHDAHSSAICKLLLTPVKESPRSATLAWYEHRLKACDFA